MAGPDTASRVERREKWDFLGSEQRRTDAGKGQVDHVRFTMLAIMTCAVLSWFNGGFRGRGHDTGLSRGATESGRDGQRG